MVLVAVYTHFNDDYWSVGRLRLNTLFLLLTFASSAFFVAVSIEGIDFVLLLVSHFLPLLVGESKAASLLMLVANAVLVANIAFQIDYHLLFLSAAFHVFAV